MPLAYLILQSVMLQFHHALLYGLDLSHPIIQHDLLRMISFLLKNQPHDAHMKEAILEAAVPQSPGLASPLPALVPCPVHGYALCPPHEVCPMNPDFDAVARTLTPPPPRTPPPTMAAHMSAPSRLMAYAGVDPTPAHHLHHRHHRNAPMTSLHLLRASSAYGLMFLMDHQLASSRTEKVQVRSHPQRVKATLVKPKHHVALGGNTGCHKAMI
jgi:hypothetical protein